MNKYLPYLLILFGFIFLFLIGIAEIAGAFLLVGYVMIVENKWPEEWGTND